MKEFDKELKDIVSEISKVGLNDDIKKQVSELVSLLEGQVREQYFSDLTEDKADKKLILFPEVHYSSPESIVYIMALNQAFINVAEEKGVNLVHMIERNEQDTKFTQEHIADIMQRNLSDYLIQYRSLIIRLNNADLTAGDPAQQSIFIPAANYDPDKNFLLEKKDISKDENYSKKYLPDRNEATNEKIKQTFSNSDQDTFIIANFGMRHVYGEKKGKDVVPLIDLLKQDEGFELEVNPVFSGEDDYKGFFLPYPRGKTKGQSEEEKTIRNLNTEIAFSFTNFRDTDIGKLYDIAEMIADTGNDNMPNTQSKSRGR